MTTTVPVQPIPSPPPGVIPALPVSVLTKIHVWNLGMHIWWRIAIAAIGILCGFHTATRFLPTRWDLFRREMMVINQASLSPVSAFVKLDEQTRTNIPPTTLTISAPDYVRTIPDSIGHLHQLTELIIRNQSIHALPDSIGQLSSLRRLVITNTPLTRLPNTLGSLTQLEQLEITGTNITTLPDSIGNLTNLKGLTLGYNKIDTLPATISRLEKLVELDLTGNRLRAIPRALPPHLKFIFLGVNPIPAQALRSLEKAGIIMGVHF